MFYSLWKVIPCQKIFSFFFCRLFLNERYMFVKKYINSWTYIPSIFSLSLSLWLSLSLFNPPPFFAEDNGRQEEGLCMTQYISLIWVYHAMWNQIIPSISVLYFFSFFLSLPRYFRSCLLLLNRQTKISRDKWHLVFFTSTSYTCFEKPQVALSGFKTM